MSIGNLATNPFRSPDWRWQRATEIVSGASTSPSRSEDSPAGYAWITQAVRFQRALVDAMEDIQLVRLAKKFPDLYWAYWLHKYGAAHQRDSIEALILSRCTDFEIGFRHGTAPKVVEAYEAVFYNVRDRLQHPAYILHHAMARELYHGQATWGTLVKLYGYFLGPHVAQAVESRFANPTWCDSPDRVNDALQDDAIATLKLKAAIAAKTIPVDGYTQKALLEQFTKFIEVERLTDSAGSAQEQLMGNIDKLLSTLPISVGGVVPTPTGQVRPPRGYLSQFDETAAELRYEEVFVASVGGDVSSLAEELQQMTFPAAGEDANRG